MGIKKYKNKVAGKEIKFNGQSQQDRFVIDVLKEKYNGTFLEIGSHHPQLNNNNTYILEKHFGWKGIMIDQDDKFVELSKSIRPNSNYLIDDATKIDYLELLRRYEMPYNIDFLQIDLDAVNLSPLLTLQLLDETVMNKYKFAVVTFEHDQYIGRRRRSKFGVFKGEEIDKDIINFARCKKESQEILKKRGYKLVLENVKTITTWGHAENEYEDWYVHPDLVDMDYINNKVLDNFTMVGNKVL